MNKIIVSFKRKSNCGLAVGFPSNVGTGVLDGPPPFNQESLSGQGYLRTVEDAGPYGFIFTLTYKPKFEGWLNGYNQIKNKYFS